MFNSRQELINEIHRYGLSEIEDAILGLAKPAVQIERTRVDEDTLPLGASKLGGNPDLPPEFEWPYWNDKPLTFIAQFKLSEVANPQLPPPDPAQLTLWDMDIIPVVHRHTEDMLPSQGILYYFYAAEEIPLGAYSEKDGWRVVYLENEIQPLTRTLQPMAPGKWGQIMALPAHRINFVRWLSLPIIRSRDTKWWESLDKQTTDKALSLDWFKSSYWKLTFEKRSQDTHYIYGYPTPVNKYVEWETVIHALQLKRNERWDFIHPNGELADINQEVDKWQFLFQIASDNSLKVMWGDLGTIYISIPKTSLHKRSFEDCWTIMQCH